MTRLVGLTIILLLSNDERINQMPKDIYFQYEAWGDVAIQHKGQVHHFSNLMSLINFVQGVHGSEFELIEVTEDNWQQLYDEGAFDEQ